MMLVDWLQIAEQARYKKRWTTMTLILLPSFTQQVTRPFLSQTSHYTNPRTQSYSATHFPRKDEAIQFQKTASKKRAMQCVILDVFSMFPLRSEH
jgi:hypothetical protein